MDEHFRMKQLESGVWPLVVNDTRHCHSIYHLAQLGLLLLRLTKGLNDSWVSSPFPLLLVFVRLLMGDRLTISFRDLMVKTAAQSTTSPRSLISKALSSPETSNRLILSSSDDIEL